MAIYLFILEPQWYEVRGEKEKISVSMLDFEKDTVTKGYRVKWHTNS